MKKLLFTFLAIIITGVPSVTGCSSRIEGWDDIHELTGEEKATLLDIALESEYFRTGLEFSETVAVEYGWAVLNWEQNLDRPSFHQFPYVIDERIRPYFEKTLERGTGVLPVIIFSVGNLELSVIIEPDSRTIVSESPGILTPVPDIPDADD